MISIEEIQAHIDANSRLLRELGPRHLDHYVYVLRDPRDGKVFYVGEGTTDRVLSHLSEALQAEFGTPRREHTAKTRRIVEIWSADEMVDWLIVSRGYGTQAEAEVAEAAIMVAVARSQNGALLNLKSGNHGSTRGAVPIEELQTLAVQAVNPSQPHQAVFLFPVQNAIADGRTPYEATRCCWDVAAHWRSIESAIAVGLVRGLSVGAFSIDQWQSSDIPGKYCFDGRPLAVSGFENARWTQVINAARGYFQRGNWLVAQFDGQGNFAILRGSANRDWQPLI